MQITIDTKKDSPADIRKIVALLSKLMEDTPTQSSNIFDNPNPSISTPTETTNAFANMFGGETPTTPVEDAEKSKMQRSEASGTTDVVSGTPAWGKEEVEEKPRPATIIQY